MKAVGPDFWLFGLSCAVFVNVSNSSDSAGFVHYKHILHGERWDGQRDRFGSSTQNFSTCRRQNSNAALVVVSFRVFSWTAAPLICTMVFDI